MDLKDITWAAEIYSSFEDMRLDVEDLFHKDIIKYVENRAQKVSVGVKTFYADILPPSCIQTSMEEFEDFFGYTAQDSTLSVRNDASDCPLMPPPRVYVGNTESKERLAMSTRSGGARCSIGIRSIPRLPKVSDEPMVPERDDSEEFSAEPLRQNNDATECNSSYHGLPPANIDTHKVESVGEEATTSYEDIFDIEVIEAGGVLEPSEKSRLEESCVLVEGCELDNVPQESKKHKSSYKKKICSVLSLKLRTPMKRDLSVPNHEDSSDKNNGCEQGKLVAPNACDFGWELL